MTVRQMACEVPARDSEAAIREAIEAATPVRDPLEELIEKSKLDPAAAFEPGILSFLADMKRDDPARFESVRARLKTAKVRVGELERVMGRTDRHRGTITSGSPLSLDSPPPWPFSVESIALFNEITTTIERYLILPRHGAQVMALWAGFTHSFDLWSISPRLAFLAPEKRCGKTTALSVMQRLVPKPLPASNISPAAVFRSIDLARPTLLIDEADTFLHNSDELRGILNSGHSRSLAYVVRTTGEDHTPTRFCTWAPIAMAKIGSLPDTLHDRSIVVHLRRKQPDETVLGFRIDRATGFEDQARKLARWAADKRDTLARWDGDVPKGLHDRAADNWRPLLAIADTVGGEWPTLARHAALEFSASEEDESASILLLGDIRALFDRLELDRLPSQIIIDHLHTMDHRPWPEWRKGKPISSRQVAALLKPFGVMSGTIRLSRGETVKGFMRAAFEDTFARYVPSSAVTA